MLQEAFSDRHRQSLISRVRAIYPHSVVGRDDFLAQDGGVVILSRFPIERQFELIFGEHTGWDSWADKGVLYARILVSGRPLHMLGTHLQAGPDNQQVRESQLARIAGLIEALGVPRVEPILLVGDLNIDRHGAHEYAAMLATTSMVDPSADAGIESTMIHDDRVLDYVLYSSRHLRATRSRVSSFDVVIEPTEAL